mmetsp:Transcript_5469/g.10425  ORF Transcript_5469/g.10425 Transcript_5469/m.10425 type:complete len:120 (+) Transcript_5469:114-473(+)
MSFLPPALEPYAGLIVSALVLVGVELASRQGNPQLAAVVAAVPTGLPLALIIVGSKNGGQMALQQFADSAVRGTCCTVGFSLGMAAVARRGGGVGAMLGGGLFVWAMIWCLLELVRGKM